MPLRICSLILLLACLFFCGTASAQNKASAPEPEAPQKRAASLMEKMNGLIIPKIQFQDITLEKALEYLRTQSRKLDTSSGPEGTKGVDIILRSKGDEPLPPVISLDLRDVPLAEALRYVTELAGMKFKVEAEAVVVIPLSEYNEEQHPRAFRVPLDFLSIGLPSSGGVAAPADPFAASPTEPEKPGGKIPRRSAKQVLEAQGITFPEGSSAFFNPVTGMLTVTNTQPNIDLVEAFTDTIHLHLPATLAHQFIIVEGPGELIRTANAAASRTANARAELDSLLDHAKNTGSKVRVAADAFFEGKSGMHSHTCAAREHVHATNLSLDKQSRASSTWDTRLLGLVLKIDQTLGADGITIDSNLDIAFHPIPPRIRQLIVTEPLSGRDAEFPVSTTTGAEFKTSLAIGSGATKLVGVTQPGGLADEKADVLWAAFLTSTVRRFDPRLVPIPSPEGLKPSELTSIAFHSPPGLLESLMGTRSQPLQDWLEKVQGITFPPGASIEQKGDQLHATNYPAMIEAIGALIAQAESIAPKTVVFTLHTIEAPATLLRDLARQSAASGADDNAVFTAAEAAAARGEARFIESLFLETKSGTRSTQESLREHSFLSDFGLNDQTLPEATFDVRKVGTVFEIEPSLGTNGRTVELNFSHELHPAPSETRGAHFRDPASGNPFAMPATDFHVLKTTSGLSMTQGSTKLISLHKPTGRDAEGKLWATFLKCDVVLQTAAKRRTTKPIPDLPDGGGLETRTYRVPPGFFNHANRAATTPSETSPPAAPFATSRSEEHRQPQPDILDIRSFDFPDGASASFNPGTSTLIVRNTLKNLALIEAWVDQILRARPATVAITTHVIQAPGPLLRRLTAQAAHKSNHRAELDELLAAVKKGDAQSLGTNRIETKPGVRAISQQGAEHTALADVTFDKEGTPKIITETRNVGFKVELEATIDPDGQTVGLLIAPEFHTAPPFEHREHVIDTRGRKLEFPLTDYHFAKVATDITMTDGTAHLLSLHKPTGKPEFEKEDILQAFFITCDILRVGE